MHAYVLPFRSFASQPQSSFKCVCFFFAFSFAAAFAFAFVVVVSLLLDDFLLLSLLSGHKSAQVVNYFIIKSATGHTLAEKGRQQQRQEAAQPDAEWPKTFRPRTDKDHDELPALYACVCVCELRFLLSNNNNNNSHTDNYWPLAKMFAVSASEKQLSDNKP